MQRTKEGYWCPKCGILIRAEAEQMQRVKKVGDADSIYVFEKPPDDYAKVTQQCPKCGNAEAFHWFSGVSGEHAGVARERTIEHFRCTKCAHTWNQSS